MDDEIPISKSKTEKITKQAEIMNPEIRNKPAEFGDVIEKAGKVWMDFMSKNSEAQIEVAKIQIPLQQKQLEIQAEVNKRHYDAKQSQENRVFLIAFFIVVFLVIAGGFLLFTNDKQNGMAIVTLLVGLVAGFLSGQGWQKSKSEQK